ncbi:hypothetical protein JZ751_001489 [Albula glossodonta]|uniref:Uncharacterized protein n=1 Tax=Albula glossodonta TaxID=121402 RepID=A0A8T2PU31_9TELE|nr:hypothetical protein JZ751_001489 [Albula glossodonta]
MEQHQACWLDMYGLDGTGRVVTCRTLDSVNGEPPVCHSRHIIVLQEDDPVAFSSTGKRQVSWSTRGMLVQGFLSLPAEGDKPQ